MVIPRHAAGILHQFRSFLVIIRGNVVDLWDVQLLHKMGNNYSQSDLYFGDTVNRPTKSNTFPTVPLLDICHDRELFRRIIASWLADPASRRIGRGAFASILQDEGFLRLSHLRELVTIIEMQAGGKRNAPALQRKIPCLEERFKSHP